MSVCLYVTWFKSPYTSIGQKCAFTLYLKFSLTNDCYGFSVSLLHREPRKRKKKYKILTHSQISKFSYTFYCLFKRLITENFDEKKILGPHFDPYQKTIS